VLKNYDTVSGDRQTFIVAGREFTVRAKVPRQSLLDLSDIEDTDARVDRFFATVLIRVDREPFLELLHSTDDDDDADCITLGQANEIMNDITEFLTGASEGKDASSTPGPFVMPEQSNVEPLPSGVVSPYVSGTSS
jgi:hypothetical protein